MAEQNPITASCVACYRLNESVDTDDAVDATGNGLTLTRGNTPNVDPNGMFGNARVIEGGDYFYSYDTAFHLQTFTVAGWYKPLPYASQYLGGGIIGKMYSGLNGVDYSWQISVSKSSRKVSFLLCLYHGGGGVFFSALSSWAIPEGVWTHIAASWDNVFGTLYINGRPHAKNLNESGITELPYDATRNFRIGRAGGQYLGLGHYGSMDDWGLYNEVMSESWVYHQYTSTYPPDPYDGVLPISSNTLIYYKADETMPGEALRDALGAERHASAYGAPNPVQGLQHGGRDCGPSHGRFFERWHDTTDCPNTMTAIAICRPPSYTPSPSTNGRVFSKIHTRGAAGLISLSSWSLGFEGLNNKPQFAVRLGGGVVVAKADNPVSFEEWHILVGTFDGSYVKIYCDGQLLKSTQNLTGTTNILYTTEEFIISANYEFRGYIDELMLMDVAVDDDWVAEYDAPYVRYHFTTLDIAPPSVEVLEQDEEYVSFPLRFKDDCKIVTIPELPYIDDILKLTIFMRRNGIPLIPLGVGIEESVFELEGTPLEALLSYLIQDGINFGVSNVYVSGDTITFVVGDDKVSVTVPYKYLKTGKDKVLSFPVNKIKTD